MSLPSDPHAYHGPAHGHAHDEHGGEHGPHVEAPHGSMRDYVTGFILSVILTAIPFWLVMDGVIANPGTTALVILGSRHIVGASAALVVETIARGPEWAGVGSAPRRLAGARSDVWMRRVQGAAPEGSPEGWRWRAG